MDYYFEDRLITFKGLKKYKYKYINYQRSSIWLFYYGIVFRNQKCGKLRTYI